MSSHLDAKIHNAVAALVADGLLTDQFFELLNLQDERNPDFLADLTGVYFATAAEDADEVASLLDIGGEVGLKQVEALAHKSMGSSASFGARLPAEACGELRDAARAGRRDACRRALDKQRVALEELRDRVATVLELDAERKKVREAAAGDEIGHRDEGTART